MVHTDAYGGVVLLTDIDKRYELRLNLLQLGLVLLVGIFQVLEGTSWVHVVAWIDANLLAVLCGHVGRMSGEVHVGHQRLVVAIRLQTGRDVLHVLCLTGALRGEANDFATCIDDAFGLCYATLRVVGVDGSHRLDADGVVATNGDIAYVGNAANSSCTHILLLLSPCWPSQSLPLGPACSH